ncbi:GNAT family N-acetyltransferase [Nonomuraea sp. NPDC052265]|uniref:GNAT family N-acetyltransferase n=1 Tax=Nonomuraea sp. NPDC052265 TaxID=3364374 RepID=UPI0037C51753
MTGKLVRLLPVGPEHVEGLLTLVSDPEVTRLTGTHGEVDREVARQWYSTRGEHPNRLDLAVMAGDEYVGEVVLNELDRHNLACNLRIALTGSRVFGKGYGTEAIELVLGHAFATTPLHRISLTVFTFNERARHVYKKIGFVEEGVQRDTLLWEGEWHDSVTMSVLRPEWQTRSGSLA